MSISSLRNAILNSLLLFKDANGYIDIPTVLLNLPSSKNITEHFKPFSYNQLVDVLEDIGGEVYSEHLGNYRSDLEINVQSLVNSKQLLNANQVIEGHCRWIFGTMADMYMFLDKERSVQMKPPAIDFVNGDIIENFKNRNPVILLGIYQNHVGYLFQKIPDLTIVSRGKYDSSEYSSFLGYFQDEINIIPANVSGGKRIYYSLKNNKVLTIYNDFLYPDSRGVSGLLFGRHVRVSETLLRLACITKAVIIPFSIVKKKVDSGRKIEVKLYDPIITSGNNYCMENSLYKSSLYTELLIRYAPEQWRLWNSLEFRWAQKSLYK